MLKWTFESELDRKLLLGVIDRDIKLDEGKDGTAGMMRNPSSDSEEAVESG